MSDQSHRTSTVALVALLVVGTSVGAVATAATTHDATTRADATAQTQATDAIVVQNESVPITIRNISSPNPIQIGTNYTVSATIVNRGDEATTEQVNYQIAANVIKTQSVEIPANDTVRVEFDITENDTAGFPTGTFVHGVFSQRANATANVTLVEEAPTPTETTTEANVTETETTTETNVTDTTTTTETETTTTTTTTETTTTETTTTTDTTTTTETETTTTETETTTETTTTETETTTTEEETTTTETETTTEANVTAEEDETAANETETPVEAAAASLVFTNQDSNGSTVTVQSATVPEGGFVVIHNTGVVEGEVVPSMRGESTYLEAGTHRNFTVELDEPINQSQRLVAVLYRDSNDNQEFDFVESGRTADGPYTEPNSEEAVNRIAIVTVVEQPTNETTEA